MQTKLLLGGLALLLACAGCNDDAMSDEQLDALEQRGDGPLIQDAGRVRVDGGADAGWDDDLDSDEDEASEEDGREPRAGADGGCRRARAGRRDRGGKMDRSGERSRPSLDGGLGIPGTFGRRDER